MTVASRPLAMAMVGGGPGSFIGPVHRMAAELDGAIRLRAGVFSRDHARSLTAAAGYGIDSDRAYPDVAAMLAAEAQRPDGIAFVAITTPNNTHLPIAAAALAAGVHVISDKPATATLGEALALQRHVAASNALYAMTYTYTGYPLVREARERVARGDLGRIRRVHVEYPQGWLADPVEHGDNKQAGWRTDPARTGVGGCISDIGVHALNLAEYVSGERIDHLLADLVAVVPGRRIDDDATLLLRFAGGARGFVAATQIAAGARNDLRLSIWGDRGGLQWSHADSQNLYLRWPDRPDEIVSAGGPWLGPFAAVATRLPAGHPEGFIEAFANIYRDFAGAIRTATPIAQTPLSGIEDGVRGLRFVDAALRSSAQGGTWQPVEETGRHN
ncbi:MULTISPECIES: Gfo/Idh/MocA family oxidoreductase [unclassified Sphingopyxis]|uniref:Gfo/Idh/MocA family protein n=1 Tax=unclassified Sphingopyxis TaxID=2614943 RepID=UPI002859D682|nr:MULTISPECIES: Gfo/Idh/MocA family oxidoreductase [unclassified Sphingopyxis]MDR7059046.1 putative dehydrogenase [Sphingopyxis sp. BE235]MDR7178768.1 putative dehydrogenase [Sphingopyxis sp. BE249]